MTKISGGLDTKNKHFCITIQTTRLARRKLNIEYYILGGIAVRSASRVAGQCLCICIVVILYSSRSGHFHVSRTAQQNHWTVRNLLGYAL